VGEGCQQVLVHDAVVPAIDAMAAFHLVGKFDVRRQILDARVVEFMRVDERRRRARPQAVAGLAQVHVAAPDGPAVHDDIGGNHADHRRRAPVPLDAAREIHQPATFGVGRQAAFDRIVQLAAQARVLAARGDLPAALDLAAQAVALADVTDYLELTGDALVHQAHVLRAAGRSNDALDAVRAALERYERKGVLPSVERTRALITEWTA